jgi:outer membrane protein OmpA-like peptidoglycan-associated protein
MKHIRLYSFVLTVFFFACLGQSAIAQNGDYRFFTVTAGVNWIDYTESLNGQDYNNVEFTNPFMFAIEGRFNESLSVSLMGTTNDVTRPGNPGESYVGVDALLHYYIDQYIWDNNDFEWSIDGGLGYYTYAGDKTKPVGDLGTGLRWWFADQWAVSAGMVAKFEIASDAALGNHFQYTAGITFGIKRKPQEQPVVEQEEDKKELETMAQQADEPLPPSNEFRANPFTSIRSTDLGDAEPMMVESVYFDRNSSYIGDSEEPKLDRLAELMLAESGRRVFIYTYTDDTGQMEYNEWLAGKRLERTASYLVNKGISPNRIQGEAKGVDPASRSCTDCTEKEERVYRRAEFKLYEQQ